MHVFHGCSLLKSTKRTVLYCSKSFCSVIKVPDLGRYLVEYDLPLELCVRFWLYISIPELQID